MQKVVRKFEILYFPYFPKNPPIWCYQRNSFHNFLKYISQPDPAVTIEAPD